MSLDDRESHKVHPDDEGIDRIEIQMVPRFKTSGLSGSEWRVSAFIRLFRKGEMVYEKQHGALANAVAFLPHLLNTACEHVDKPLWGETSKCYQVSCPAEGKHKRYLKQQYSSHGEGPLPELFFNRFRRFCDKHLHRGDGDLEDADINYTEVPPELSPIPDDGSSANCGDTPSAN